jgi:hypothetical protein
MSINAIWSFWSKPFLAHRQSAWPSELHHLLAWVLSVETAKQHYRETYLYTDDAGARLLVEELGLRFTQVSTALNALAGVDPEWWALGKLYTYQLQRAPFVHLDNDVFLWKPLPDRLTSAAVFAQNPEPFTPGHSYYQPAEVEWVLNRIVPGWLPAEWIWFRRSGRPQRGECCGIMGGNDLDFIQHYAGQALKFLAAPANQSGLRALGEKQLHMLLLEQYLLAACVEYNDREHRSAQRTSTIDYLFGSPGDSFNPAALACIGYTHLAAGAKRNPHLARQIERRVHHDYPTFYTRCVQLTERNH